MDPINIIAQGKVKRFFRARRKLIHPHIVSHITQRAAGKEPSFLENDDYLHILGLLKEISAKHALTVLSFCLMPNHVHLLLRTGEKNLDQAMRDLFSRYATWFNRKYERKGHLFGGPYRQAVCLDDAYLLAVSIYIHLNPVRAKLEENPLQYRWSSARLYCKQDAPAAFVKPDFILSLLSENSAESKKRYVEMLNKGVELEIEHVLEQEDAIEKFRSGLVKLFPKLFSRANKKKPVNAVSGIELFSIEELERQTEAIRNAGPSRRPETVKAKIFLMEQMIARGYKRSEIAQKLEMSPKTVFNILKSKQKE
jgi:putative transposase